MIILMFIIGIYLIGILFFIYLSKDPIYTSNNYSKTITDATIVCWPLAIILIVVFFIVSYIQRKFA